MFEIRYAAEVDKGFWFTLDMHMSEDEFLLKIRDRRGYIIFDGDKPIGVMRYNLFWDNIPFLTLICFDGAYQGKGSLSFDNTPLEQPMEMFLLKNL